MRSEGRMRAVLIALALVLVATVQVEKARPAAAGPVCSWSLMPKAPGGYFEQGIAGTSHEEAWVVADNLKNPVVSLFDGTSWHAHPITDPGSDGGSLRVITAISADDIWAVGSHDVIALGSHPNPLA